MKSNVFKKLLMCLCCFFVMITTPVFAGDEWEDILKNITVDEEFTSGQEFTGILYGATVTFMVTDYNGDLDDFDNNDRVDMTIDGFGIDTLSFEGTKDELIDWSKDNMTDLFKAIFGNAPDTTVSGMTDSQAMAQQLVTSVYGTPEHKGTKFTSISNKDIVLKGQYDFLEIDDVDAKGASGIIAYEHRFKNLKGHSIGISVPYRQLSLDDNVDSSYNYVAFIPFYKHRWYPRRSLVEWVLQGTFGLTYLESVLFPDGGGFLEYGGGTSLKYAYAVNERISVNAGVALSILKKNIPSDLVPEDIDWVVEALSDLPTEIDVTPSLGVYVAVLPGKLFFRGDLFRTHQIQDDVEAGFENQTVAIGGLTYVFPKGSRISLGYKRSFEMKDITDQSFIIDFKLKW